MSIEMSSRVNLFSRRAKYSRLLIVEYLIFLIIDQELLSYKLREICNFDRLLLSTKVSKNNLDLAVLPILLESKYSS